MAISFTSEEDMHQEIALVLHEKYLYNLEEHGLSNKHGFDAWTCTQKVAQCENCCVCWEVAT